MKTFNRTETTVPLLIIILAAAVCVYFLSGTSGFAVDDSFIFFRYAENVGTGNGFVFNAGEGPGEGFTSWAWLLLLSAARLVGVPLLQASKVLGVSFFLLSAGLLYLVVYRLPGGNRGAGVGGALTAGLFLSFFPMVAHGMGGMETSLYIFALLSTVYVTLGALEKAGDDPRWWLWLSLAAFFIFTVRPEGIVAGGISLLAVALKHRAALKVPRVWLYGFLGLVLPMMLFLGAKTLYFGYPLPLSFYHKVIGGEGGGGGAALKHFRAFLTEYRLLLVPAALTAVYTLFVRRETVYWYFLVLFCCMVAVYLNFMPVMNYLHRFYIPYTVLLLILLAPVLTRLAGEILSMESRAAKHLVVLMLFAVMALGMNGELQINRRRAQNWERMVKPDRYRGKLGQLMRHLPPETVVANTEMGVIPYFSGLTCLDMAGLTDPVVAHRGLSMAYLMDRGTDLILFPRDVEKMPEKRLKNSPRGYGKVFLSKTFKTRFQLLGSFAAWPDPRSRYYFYVDRESPLFEKIKRWWTARIAGEKPGPPVSG